MKHINKGFKVHGYYDQGIKIDKNTLIFDLAIAKNYIFSAVDKTYSEIDHYVWDLEME